MVLVSDIWVNKPVLPVRCIMCFTMMNQIQVTSGVGWECPNCGYTMHLSDSDYETYTRVYEKSQERLKKEMESWEI